MKKKIQIAALPLCLGCILLSVNHAAAASIPFLRLDNSSYEAGEEMDITLLNTENMDGRKYLEIVWDDTGNIIFRTELDGAQLSVPAPAKEGGYTVRITPEIDIVPKSFTVTNSREDACSLKGEVEQSEMGQVLGVLLQWDEIAGDQAYFVTRVQADGASVRYGPIYETHWIDADIAPNTTYAYSVSKDSVSSNTVILDVSEFVSVEYIKNHNTGTIELNIGSPYMVVNGCSEQIDPQNIGIVPVVTQERVMLPIRALVEKMGGTVAWNDERQSVMLAAWGREVEIPVGSNTIWVNGTARTFDVPARIEQYRTLVPIRHLEALGCQVEWVGEVQTVLIHYQMDEEA